MAHQVPGAAAFRGLQFEVRRMVENGELVIAPGTGDIQTKESFGDVQLHVEWRAPQLPPDKVNQDRAPAVSSCRTSTRCRSSITSRRNLRERDGWLDLQTVRPLVNATLPRKHGKPTTSYSLRRGLQRMAHWSRRLE